MLGILEDSPTQRLLTEDQVGENDGEKRDETPRDETLLGSSARNCSPKWTLKILYVSCDIHMCDRDTFFSGLGLPL